MILIFCVDDKGGRMFGGRRQSQDRLVREDMLRQAAGRALWMNAYTAKQFAGHEDAVRVSETCLDKAGAGEYCFIEGQDVSAYLDKAEGLVVYRWNRRYPADMYFAVPPDGGWKQTAVREFAGFSHEKITKEVYCHE